MVPVALLCAALTLPWGVGPLAAQAHATLRSLGGAEEDRARLSELLGRGSSVGVLRSGSEPTVAAAGVRWLLPEALVVQNSGLITTLGDGALWAGRGSNLLVRGGVTIARGRLRLTVAPELTASENRAVEVKTVSDPARSTWADPWRTPEAPLDRPLRFGVSSVTTIHPGQSELTVELGRTVIGIGAGNLWWGPGLRNALVLGDNAPGIPRFFVRTPEALGTPIGDVRGEWFVGGLTESVFFDTLPANDVRAASGLAITLAPPALPGLTVGVARLIVVPVDGAGGLVARAFDPLTTWNGADAERDQLTSVFGRWVVPGEGIEFWGEYAWQRLPASLREWLVAPNADAAWTVGAQWAVPRDDGAWRAQVEFSDLAQSRVATDRAPRDFYTGQATAQGFTQRGQLLGAAVGPGATHGWVAVDRVREQWSLGVMVARTRWENDAFYRQPLANPFGHDVSIFSGVRGGRRTPRIDVSASLLFERRYNYQFESRRLQPLAIGQRNEDNVRFSLRLAPR